jgi:hypothetical protein
VKLGDDYPRPIVDHGQARKRTPNATLPQSRPLIRRADRR